MLHPGRGRLVSNQRRWRVMRIEPIFEELCGILQTIHVPKDRPPEVGGKLGATRRGLGIAGLKEDPIRKKLVDLINLASPSRAKPPERYKPSRRINDFMLRLPDGRWLFTEFRGYEVPSGSVTRMLKISKKIQAAPPPFSLMIYAISALEPTATDERVIRAVARAGEWWDHPILKDTVVTEGLGESTVNKRGVNRGPLLCWRLYWFLRLKDGDRGAGKYPGA